MSAPLTAGLAPGLVLSGGYVLRVTALSPTTGAVVAGVVVSDVSLQVDALEPIEDVPPVPKFQPLFTYGRAQ